MPCGQQPIRSAGAATPGPCRPCSLPQDSGACLFAIDVSQTSEAVRVSDEAIVLGVAAAGAGRGGRGTGFGGGAGSGAEGGCDMPFSTAGSARGML